MTTISARAPRPPAVASGITISAAQTTLLLAPGPAAAAHCRPVPVLNGAAPLIDAVHAALAPHAAKGAVPICPAVEVRLKAVAAASPWPSLDANGEVWFGGRAGGCVVTGGVCLGGLVRLAEDRPALTGSNRSRYEGEALLTAGVPLRWRQLRLMPALGVGVGWTHARDDSDPSDSGVDDDRSPRVELSLTVSVPIGRLSVAALMALDASTAGGTIAESGALVQPWGYFRLGRGVQWGAP
jgi:hypothetical protein